MRIDKWLPCTIGTGLGRMNIGSYRIRWGPSRLDSVDPIPN